MRGFPVLSPGSVAQRLLGPQVALLAGVGARVWFYLLNDSFWRDESKVLLAVAQRSFLGLLGPMEYGDAPYYLLWLYRLFYLAGGGGELSVRAFSLATSILALVLFYFLARRVLSDRRALLFSTWLLALAPGVILFAGMAKQYSLDLLVTSGLLWLAFRCLTAPQGAAPLGYLTLAASLAPWISYQALFVVAALGLGLVLRFRSLGLLPVAGFLAVVAVSVSLELLTVLNRLLAPGRLELISLYQIPWSSIHNWGEWLFCQIFYAYVGPLNVSYAFVDPRGCSFSPLLYGVAGLALLGLWESRRQYGWAWVAVLAGPLVICLGAWALNLYAPHGRYILFVTPGLYLLAGYGASLLFQAVRRPGVVGIFLIILVLPCGYASLAALGRPLGGVREGLQYIAAHQQPGDVVFFDTYAAPTVDYYRLLGRPYARTLRYGLEAEEWIEFKVDQRNLRPEVLLPLVPPGKRVWLVAETLDYARGPAVGVLPYWQEFEQRLGAERKMVASYTTARVQVRAFSPRP